MLKILVETIAINCNYDVNGVTFYAPKTQLTGTVQFHLCTNEEEKKIWIWQNAPGLLEHAGKVNWWNGTDTPWKFSYSFWAWKPDVPPFSPYMFGSGKVNLDEIITLGSMDGGTLTALDHHDHDGKKSNQEPTPIEVPVRIKLLTYSGRVTSPSLSEGGNTLRFIGMGMKSVDVAGELTREETERELQKEGSRRDQFLRRLLVYKKEEEKQQKLDT